MTLDPNVDRQLAELWAIADNMTRLVRDAFNDLKAEASRWEPAPCPPRKEFP